MKKFYLPALCLLSISNARVTKVFAQPLAQNTNAFSESVVDAIVVSVGDFPLLLSEVQKAIYVASDKQTKCLNMGKLVGGSIGPKEAQDILEQLIDQKILSLRVNEMNLNVADDELDIEIQSFLKGQNLTKEKFLALLAQEGETEESHREEFKNQLETQRFIGRVIRPLVSVTAEETKNFYLSQTKGGSKAQKVKLRSLVLETNDQNSAKKQKTATSIRAELDKGASFESLVKLYSDSPDALKSGGILPARPAKDLPSEIKSRMDTLKLNDVVGPVAIGSSLFFFQYLGSELTETGEFEKQKTTWENKLLETKFRERLSEYLKAERSKIKIARRAFKFS